MHHLAVVHFFLFWCHIKHTPIFWFHPLTVSRLYLQYNWDKLVFKCYNDVIFCSRDNKEAQAKKFYWNILILRMTRTMMKLLNFQHQCDFLKIFMLNWLTFVFHPLGYFRGISKFRLTFVGLGFKWNVFYGWKLYFRCNFVELWLLLYKSI